MLRLRLPIAIALIALVASTLHARPEAAPTAAPAPDAVARTPPALERLRPQSPRIRLWLTRGLQQSETMRTLAARIARGDVIVYLELARRLDADVAACVTWIAAAPGARYVRVSVRPTLREADAIAMLAHELQHVVEVIEHPDVRSSVGLTALYQRIGHRSGSTGITWDTLAAYDAGNLARVEVLRGGRPAAGV